jgi:cytoskeletal protein RodZ
MENHHIAPDQESLGDLFRKMRKEKDLEISDVAQETRIPPHTVRAIEADDFSMLPALAFARGFYSLYAKLLELDQDEILQRFVEEYAQDESNEKQGDVYPQQWQGENVGSLAERPTYTAGSIISFSLLVIVLAAAGISWYAGYNPAKHISNWLRGFQETPGVEVMQEQTEQPLQDTRAESPAVEETLPLQFPAKPELPAIAEARFQLVAEFQESADISIGLDEAEPETLSLPGGSIETWEAEERIVMELPGNAVVRLYLNGIVVPLPPAVDDKIVVSIPDYFLD